MRYDPQSIWGATVRWWLAELPQEKAFGVGRPHMLHLYVYVRGEDEPYYMAGPKLYRKLSSNADGSFVNCEQDELAEVADQLGHVIARSRMSRTERFWPTWADFAQEVGIANL